MPPVQQIPIVPGASAAGDVYFNRTPPKPGTSYDDYDEAWHAVNGTDTHSVPDNGILQEVDFSKGLDRLKFNNYFDHDFRFSGINGGYYNPDDGNYYDVSGVLSDKATEFPAFSGSRFWILDHLTGVMYIGIRLGATDYITNLDDSAVDTYDGYSDMFVPWFDLSKTLTDHRYSNIMDEPDRPPWEHDQSDWTSTPRANAPTTQGMYQTTFGGFWITAKTNASANRFHARFFGTGKIDNIDL